MECARVACSSNRDSSTDLIRVGDLKLLGYATLEEWLLASEHHVYLGRNLAHFIGRKELLEFVHTRRCPYVDVVLTKNIACQRTLRLIKAIQLSRFWDTPLNIVLIGGRDRIENFYKAFIKRTGRREYAHLLEGKTFACPCKNIPCQHRYLSELARESKRERLVSIEQRFSNPYVYIR